MFEGLSKKEVKEKYDEHMEDEFAKQRRTKRKDEYVWDDEAEEYI